LQGKSKQLNVGDRITVYGETTIVYLLDGEQKLALNIHCVPETIDTVEGGNTIDKAIWQRQRTKLGYGVRRRHFLCF